MLLALGAASFAAVEGLRLVLPGWLAALAVAAVWAGITALFLWVDHPRRLWRRLRQQTHEQAMTTALDDRSRAEADVRAAAERLSHAISTEMREREARAIIAGEKRLISTGERDAEVVLKELMSILAAPWASRSQPARATPGRQCVKADGQMIRALRRRQGLPRGLRSKCIRLTSTAITVTR